MCIVRQYSTVRCCVVSEDRLIDRLIEVRDQYVIDWLAGCMYYAVDVDECNVTADVCGSHAQCINLNGGYRCECSVGFAFDDDTAMCTGTTSCHCLCTLNRYLSVV